MLIPTLQWNHPPSSLHWLVTTLSQSKELTKALYISIFTTWQNMTDLYIVSEIGKMLDIDLIRIVQLTAAMSKVPQITVTTAASPRSGSRESHLT